MGGGHSVLVVDDEPSIRLLCKVNLELEGYTVLEADTLEDARRQLRATPVSVVLLDVHVGSEDGRELLAEIHTQWPSTRIALFSGTSGYAGVATAGADAVIPKPFTLDHLTETVARLASGARV
ncbi:MAG TPA: response regulator [Gaiellaceae bacterium]|jgi:two-component system C4-dicarboxylate transport response regulator DctD|nr:response regulator [Gaiellaceae bacterium]